MEKYTLFTNNTLAAEFFANKDLPLEVRWVAAPAIDVLSAAKSAARQGGIVLSNPLSGVRSTQPLFPGIPTLPGRPPTPRSSGPNVSSINPYLSVLVSPHLETVDFGSVQRLDEAMSLYKKNARLRFQAHNDEAIKNYQKMDMEIVVATLTHLANMKPQQ